MSKPFSELNKDEATELAKNCVRGAKSEDEIRRRLTESGFDGAAAAVTSTSHSSHGMTMFMAMVMVWGPRGEVISA
jgi:hypothetical protein